MESCRNSFRVIGAHLPLLYNSLACWNHTHKPGHLQSNRCISIENMWIILLKITCWGKDIKNLVRILSFKIYLEGSKLLLSTPIVFNTQNYFSYVILHLVYTLDINPFLKSMAGFINLNDSTERCTKEGLIDFFLYWTKEKYL